MSDLPEGWSEQPLADVAFLKTGPFGSALKKSDYVHDGIPVVNPMHIADGAIYPSPHMTISDDTARRLSEFLLSEGDVVMGRRGEMGRCAVVTTKEDGWLCGSGSFIVRPKKAVDPRYLQRFLSSPEVIETLTRSSVGSTMVNLNQQIMKSLSIPLPPLAEQKRIADKLDALLARVDACRARLGRVPALLKRFRQAVLAAAVAGRLTEDWREENEISPEIVISELQSRVDGWKTETPSGKKFKEPVSPDLSHWSIDTPSTWQVNSVSSFARCLDHLRIPVKREERKSLHGLYPYYGANGLVDMVDEYIFDGELVLVTEDETFYGREKPIAYRVSGQCWVNNHAHVLDAGDQISSDYLCYCLMYYNVLPWLTGTTGRAKLTQGVLNSLPISIPPRNEMIEIVRRVETLFAYADRLEARLAAA